MVERRQFLDVPYSQRHEAKAAGEPNLADCGDDRFSVRAVSWEEVQAGDDPLSRLLRGEPPG